MRRRTALREFRKRCSPAKREILLIRSIIGLSPPHSDAPNRLIPRDERYGSSLFFFSLNRTTFVWRTKYLPVSDEVRREREFDVPFKYYKRFLPCTTVLLSREFPRILKSRDIERPRKNTACNISICILAEKRDKDWQVYTDHRDTSIRGSRIAR